MSVGKVSQVSQTKPWPGELSPGPPEAPLYAQYTYGLAGERFFREIKDHGKLSGTKCPNCNLTYLPARLFCERCFAELSEWCEVGNKGKIHTYTLSWVDLDGSRLAEPIILAFVTLDGVHGGLVHRVGEIKADQMRIGLPVEVAFKAQRERIGSILDIKYFKPLSS